MKGRGLAGPRQLEVNALALMAGTVVSAGVGLLFWAAAARLYSTAEVGRASAVISTAALLGNVSHLNLGNVYARFLPTAGPRVRSLVRRGLLLTATVGIVVGTTFVLLWPTDSLFASRSEAVLFPLAVAALTAFTVQDAVLLGLRAAPWIPVKNVVFSIVKLALLVALAAALPHGGLVVAWMAPAAAAVVVVVVLLHRVLMPRAMSRDGAVDTLPGPRAMVGYAAGEYTTGLMAYLVPMLLPLIIVARLGPEANAYFAMPWVISTALNMLLWNIAASFVVEAASDEARLRALTRRSLRLALVIACAGAATLLLAAPLVLRAFGEQYAEQGADLLRFMALAAPATVVTTVYSAVARVRRQVGRVVLVQGLIGLTVTTLTLLLIAPLGVRGVGLAYLAAEGLAGAVLLGPLLRSLRDPTGAVSPVAPHPCHRAEYLDAR